MFITKRKHYKEIEKLHDLYEKYLDVKYDIEALSDKEVDKANLQYRITLTFSSKMIAVLYKYNDDDVFVDHLFEGIKHKLKAELKKLVKKLRMKK